MRWLIAGLICLSATLGVTELATAGPLGSHLSFDGTPDVLDDDSVSLVVDRDGDSALSVGDIVFGVLRIGSTTESGVLSPTDQLIGVFSFEILTSTGVAGADPTVTLTHTGTDPGDGTGLSIDELFGTAFGTSAGVAVLSSDPNPTDITTLTPGAAIAALGAYSLEAVLGFGAASDYLEIRSSRDTDDSGELDFSELPTGASFIGSEAGGLSVLSHSFGASVIFLPVSSTHTDGSTVTLHDVDIQGTLFGPRADTPSGWRITDSTFITVNAVPEPTSMALLGIGLFGLAGAGYRRRRRVKKEAA